jgi:hypothetical protein
MKFPPDENFPKTLPKISHKCQTLLPPPATSHSENLKERGRLAHILINKRQT